MHRPLGGALLTHLTSSDLKPSSVAALNFISIYR